MLFASVVDGKCKPELRLSIQWKKSKFSVKRNLLEKALAYQRGSKILSIKSANFVVKMNLSVPKVPNYS